MAEHLAARGSGHLLGGLDVAILDLAGPTLVAAWWLTELGATVTAPAEDVGTSTDRDAGLPAVAVARLAPHRPGPHTYAVGTRSIDRRPTPHDATTALWLVDPVAPDGPELDGWHGAAAWAASGMAALTVSVTERGAIRIPIDDHAG